MDCCASTQDVKHRTGMLTELGFGGRHSSISTIVITQQLTSIAKPYRMNISKLVTFYNPNKHDMDAIFNGYLPAVKDRKKLAIVERKLMENRYARLEINMAFPGSHEVKIPELNE